MFKIKPTLLLIQTVIVIVNRETEAGSWKLDAVKWKKAVSEDDESKMQHALNTVKCSGKIPAKSIKYN